MSDAQHPQGEREDPGCEDRFVVGEPWQGPIAGEYFNHLPDPLRTQAVLRSMHEGVADIVRSNPVEFGKRYVSQDGWEIIIAPPRSAGELPAIKHARRLGD